MTARMHLTADWRNMSVVGGVLLVQERAQAFIKNESIYGDWYSRAQAADQMQTSTEPFGIALTPNASAVDLGIIQGSVTAPFLIAQAELQRKQLMQAFTYSPEHNVCVCVCALHVCALPL